MALNVYEYHLIERLYKLTSAIQTIGVWADATSMMSLNVTRNLIFERRHWSFLAKSREYDWVDGWVRRKALGHLRRAVTREWWMNESRKYLRGVTMELCNTALGVFAHQHRRGFVVNKKWRQNPEFHVTRNSGVHLNTKRRREFSILKACPPYMAIASWERGMVLRHCFVYTHVQIYLQ